MEAIKGFFYRSKVKAQYKEKSPSINEEDTYKKMFLTTLNDHVNDNTQSSLKEELDDLSKNIGKYAMRLNTKTCIEIFCNVVRDFKSMVTSKYQDYQASQQTDRENSLTNVMIVYANMMKKDNHQQTTDTSDKDFTRDVSPSSKTAAYNGFYLNEEEETTKPLSLLAFLV